uniref:hypothetical protein n=1 Tax=uncultured Bacteroides sp. TaxID=162156 RepID=UPI0025DA46FF|nr:hypothetical protein [uncultured Bacteroides sp.]
MSNLQEILHKESENTHSIYLYREGVFYKAYEHSAYLFVKYVKPFMVKKRFVKSVNQEVVSIGFPTNSLHNYFEKDKIQEDENSAEVILTEPVDLADFNEWKKTIEQVPEVEKKQKKETSILSQQNPIGNESVVILKIKTFPMEAKTPLDCMMFLSELKKML